MGRKKKKREADPAPAKPKPVKTSLAALLDGVSIDEPPAEPPKKAPPRTTRAARAETPAAPSAAPTARPSDTLRGEDKIAFHQAMSGVRPMRAKAEAAARKRPERVASVAPELAAADDEVRARLGALVAGNLHFDIARDGDRVLGRRAGLPLRLADDLSRKSVVPEATLDLHGMRAAEATRELVRWIREQQRRGASHVCVVHGKGLHSESGISTLRDLVVEALTEGGAAPAVRAFGSAHRSRGGTGALIVALEPA